MGKTATQYVDVNENNDLDDTVKQDDLSYQSVEERYVDLKLMASDLHHYYHVDGLVWDGDIREMVPGNVISWQRNDLMYQLTAALNKHLNNVQLQLEDKRNKYLAARRAATSAHGQDDARRKLEHVKNTQEAFIHAQELMEVFEKQYQDTTGRYYKRFDPIQRQQQPNRDEVALNDLDREAAAYGINYVDKDVQLNTDGVNTTERDEVRIQDANPNDFDIPK